MESLDLTALNEHCCKVVYKKKGEEETSEMICTKNFEFIPDEFHPKKKDDDSKSKNTNQCRVFNIEKQAWRSFLIPNVVSIEIQNA